MGAAVQWSSVRLHTGQISFRNDAFFELIHLAQIKLPGAWPDSDKPVRWFTWLRCQFFRWWAAEGGVAVGARLGLADNSSTRFAIRFWTREAGLNFFLIVGFRECGSGFQDGWGLKWVRKPSHKQPSSSKPSWTETQCKPAEESDWLKISTKEWWFKISTKKCWLKKPTKEEWAAAKLQSSVRIIFEPTKACS